MSNQENYHSRISQVPIAELIDMAKNNEQQAFAELYRRYSHYISYVVTGIVHDKAEAQEVLQDTFIKAFKMLPEYKHWSFGYWLKAIATNKSIDWLRHRNRQEAEISIDNDNGIKKKQSSDANILNELLKQFDVEELKALSSKLRWKEREVFRLRYVEHLTYREIAEKLNVTIGTIKRRIHNVKKSLIKLNNTE